MKLFSEFLLYWALLSITISKLWTKPSNSFIFSLPPNISSKSIALFLKIDSFEWLKSRIESMVFSMTDFIFYFYIFASFNVIFFFSISSLNFSAFFMWSGSFLSLVNKPIISDSNLSISTKIDLTFWLTVWSCLDWLT